MSDSEGEFEDGQDFYFGEYDGERNEAGERYLPNINKPIHYSCLCIKKL